jgi:hypothetical protein
MSEGVHYCGLPELKKEGTQVAFDIGADPPETKEPTQPLDIEPGYYWVNVGGDDEIGEYSPNGTYNGRPGWLLTGNECPFSLDEVTLLSSERIKRSCP